MKKVIYQSLYRIFLPLSNHFNNRFFVKCKVLLGTALIVLTSSCSKDDDEPEIMCYDPAPPKETAEVRPVTPPSSEEPARFIEKV